MIFLRQSTASQEIPLGRFVDSTDGNTEETGLTIANTDIKIWKTGATTLASKNSGGATHIANGEYYCVLDATDTDTIGPLKVTCHVSGALYVQVFCTVLDEAVYDVMFGTTALATATNLTTAITMLTGIVPVNGTIGATGNTTTTLHLSGLAYADDSPNKMLLTIKDVSTGLFYSRWIDDFANTGDLATVETLPFTPEASVDLYWITAVRKGDWIPLANMPINWPAQEISATGVVEANVVESNGGPAELVTEEEIADAILSRDVANVEDTSPEYSLATVVLANLNNAIVDDVLTIKKTDNTTYLTKDLTLDGGAVPITGIA